MKKLKSLVLIVCTVALSTAPWAGLAEEKKADKVLIPDKLGTCPVSGEKLGSMDKPFIMEYKGQEVKLCCKNCKKDFDKNPAKYVKKIREADKTDKTKAQNDPKN